MTKQLLGWKNLNDLARQYHAEVQKNVAVWEPTKPNEKYREVFYDKASSLIDNRTARQKELASKIISGSTRFLYGIAVELLNGSVEIPTRNGPQIISLKKYRDNISVEELVNEAAIGMLKKLKNYDSNKGSISTFMHFNAVSIMYRYAGENSGLIRIPVHATEKVGKYLHDDIGRGEAVKKIMKATGKKAPTADAIYLGLTNKYVEIHGKAGGSSSDSPSTTKFEEVFLKDEEAQTDEETLQNDLAIKVREAMATLTPREEKVIRMRFGIGYESDHTLEEVGQEFLTTRESIRQIEAKALRKLRHPSRSKKLRSLHE